MVPVVGGAVRAVRVFMLDYLRDRVQASLSARTASDFNHELGVLQQAAIDHDTPREAHRLQLAINATVIP